MGLKLRIIINPSSGRETSLSDLDNILLHLSSYGNLERSDICYTAGQFDAMNFAMNTNASDYDAVVAMGGDGTVNEVVTGLMKGGVDLPLAIYTAGTVNDFATINHLPHVPADFARMLARPSYVRTDCGKVNDRYFLNVVAGGLMTDVAYKVSSDFKTAIGPAAYWITAMKDLPTINKAVPLTIKANGNTYNEEAIMFMIGNTKSVGGFRNLMSRADITDGLLDVLVLRKMDPVDVVPLLGSLVIGEHINNEHVLYFQTESLTLESGESIVLDIDGEEGPSLPATITCIKEAINLIVPAKEEPL
ncbi:MAG: diacylglycerol kinase family lipid kinase [Saccharofermentans sp.]|nr:diacylglycerol kinase family lipid kinase [Saccharofermentans sp.]